MPPEYGYDAHEARLRGMTKHVIYYKNEEAINQCFIYCYSQKDLRILIGIWNASVPECRYGETVRDLVISK